MRGERPFIYHTPNGREMFQPLQKFFARPTDGCGKPLRRGRRPAVERSGTNALGVRRPVSAARPRCKAPSGRGLSAQPTGGREKPYDSSPSVSASRCHLPRRGRQGENGLPRRFAPRNDSASRCMVRRPTKKEAPSRVLPLHILNASAAYRTACSAMCPDSGTAAPAGSE